jgi:hypothetical protein
MAQRVTKATLEYLALKINEITDKPKKPWIKEDGKLKAQIGCHFVSYNAAGVSLDRICNEGGAVTTLFSFESMTKRDLSNRMRAFITGLNTATKWHN